LEYDVIRELQGSAGTTSQFWQHSGIVMKVRS